MDPERGIGKRIVILGCPGSGKSTLAATLGRITGIPVFHLDNLWWREDRTHVTREEFDRGLAEVLSRDRWILDGDYHRTWEVRIRRCDTVLFLDYDEAVCLEGIARRTGRKRPDIPWTEEAVDSELAELVRNYRRDRRPALLELLERHPEKRALVFRDRAGTEEWLAEYAHALKAEGEAGMGFRERIGNRLEEVMELEDRLCRIPAPSGKELQRAEFVKEWLSPYGKVEIDEAYNAVFTGFDDGGEGAYLFCAHMDTVFPDTEPFEPVRKGEKYCCPGAGDDTLNLACMMVLIRHLKESGARPRFPILFAANSCEEGLGNLKGARKLLETYGSRLAGFVSFDAYYDAVCTGAVGSHRYRVTVRTAGGHSYGNFGNPNAIERLSSLIRDLYAVKVPEGPRTTYNVGEIRGGTSVNTIAQDASMLFEYRSGDAGNLAYMKKRFEEAVRRLRDAGGAEVEVELVGERPCSQGVDSARHETLIRWAEEALKTVPGQKEIPRISSSTDCNVPLSMGIPAVCFGLFAGAGAHTREEYVLPDTILLGMRAGAAFLDHFFETD